MNIKDNFELSLIKFDSRFHKSSSFETNQDVGLFLIQVKQSPFYVVIDPDTLPSLFKKNGLLHHTLKNLEIASETQPLAYSTLMSFKKNIKRNIELIKGFTIKRLSKYPDH